MTQKITTIIFDWGRTLHDPETDALFAGVAELMRDLSQRYTLALVSLAKSDTPEHRRKKIDETGIAGYFKYILVGGEDKDEMYDRLLGELHVSPDAIILVDDRMIRGVAWGNRNGIETVWIKKGKFADELPTTETGEPSHTIHDIAELKTILH